MSSLGTLTVQLTADTARLVQGLEKGKGELNSFSAAAGKLAAGAAAAFAGLSGAVFTVTRALEQQEAAELRLASAIQGSGEAIDIEKIKAYASELQGLTRFGDEETLGGAAILQTFKLTEDQLLTMIPAMQNVSALMGTDLKSAALQLGKALDGPVGGLSRMGISMDDASKAAFELADRQERVAILARTVSSNVGNAAQLLAGTATGRFTQAANEFGDILEELGRFVEAPLMVAFETLRDVLNTVKGAIASLSPETKTLLGTITLGVTAVTGLTTVFAALAAIAPVAITAMLPIIGTIAAIAGAVAGAILLVGALKQAWVGDLGGIRTALQDFFRTTNKWWKDNADVIRKTVLKTLDDLEEKFILITSFLSGKSAEEAGLIVGESRRSGGLLGLGEGGTTTDDVAKVADVVAGTVGQGLTEAVSAFKSTLQSGVEALGLDSLMDQISALGETTTETAKKMDEGAESAKMTLAEKFPKTIDKLNEIIETNMASLNTSGGRAGLGTRMEDARIDTAALEDQVRAERAAHEATIAFGASTEEVAAGIKAAGKNLVGQMGEAGEIAMAFWEGMEMGGPIVAFINLILAIVTKLEIFDEILSIISEDLDIMLESFNEALGFLVDQTKQTSEALQPFFEEIGGFVSSIAGLLEVLATPIMMLLKPALEAVGFLLKGLAIILNFISAGIRFFGNAMIDVATEFMRFIGNFTDTSQAVEDLQRSRFIIDLKGESEALARGEAVQIRTQGEMQDSLQEDMENAIKGAFKDANVEEAVEEGIVEPMSDLSGAVEETSATFRELNESITNIPTGFKVAAARFGAIDTSDASLSAGLAPSLGVMVNVGIDGHQVDSRQEMVREQRKFLDGSASEAFFETNPMGA